MSLPKGDEVQTQAQSAGGAPSAVPAPCPSGDVPKEGSRDIQQKGKIISVPHDWCKSTDSPVPYKIWAWQSSSSNLANTVRQTDCGSHVLGSTVTQCFGDEPGTGGGVKSGTNLAECTPLSASPTVRAQDRPMVRYLDKWWMNHGNTWGCLNNSEDMGRHDTPKVQKIDARLSPNPSREEDQQAAADGTKVAGGAPAPAPAPEPPPPAPPPTTSPGGNVVPFTGTTTDGPIYDAPSNPIGAANPTGAAAPSGPNFFHDYQPVVNDQGGYTYQTDLPAPLDRVSTFSDQFIHTAPGKDFFRINDGNNTYLTGDQLNQKYLQQKREIRAQKRKKEQQDADAQGQHQLRVTRNGVTLSCFNLSQFLKNKPEADHEKLITEYCRQLKRQQDAMNKMTVDQYEQAQQNFAENGRSNDQSTFRSNTLTGMANDMVQNQGMSASDAMAAAKSQMSGQVPLHEPDQVAASQFSKITGWGASNVNSSIGPAWPSRLAELNSYLAATKPKKDSNLNIKLCAEVDGQEVC